MSKSKTCVMVHWDCKVSRQMCVCSQSVLVFGTAPAFLRLVKSCQSWHVTYPDTLPLGQLGTAGSLSCKDPAGHYQLAGRPKGALHQPPAGSMRLPHPPEGLLYKRQHIPWFQAPRLPNHMFHHKALWYCTGTLSFLDFSFIFEERFILILIQCLN